MKTWRQLEAMAKRREIRLKHYDNGTTAVLFVVGAEVARVEWWTDDRKTRDRILRAMVEAALKEGR